jgi:SAM-dependent methyltransferase
MVQALRIGPGTTVVDVGAGTGKLTRLLAARRVRPVAVDPVPAMLHQLIRTAPGVPAVGGRAEALPVQSGCADAVTVAQAFHWFAGPVALSEIRRILRPGGGLGLIWNIRDDSVPWVAEMTEIIERHRGDTPGALLVDWKASFSPSSGFGPLEHRTFAFGHSLSRDAVLDRVLSISFISTLPHHARETVRSEVLALLDEDPATRERNTIVLPYRTDVYVARSGREESGDALHERRDVPEEVPRGGVNDEL